MSCFWDHDPPRLEKAVNDVGVSVEQGWTPPVSSKALDLMGNRSGCCECCAFRKVCWLTEQGCQISRPDETNMLWLSWGLQRNVTKEFCAKQNASEAATLDQSSTLRAPLNAGII